MEILTGIKITSGGSVGSWELYVTAPGKIAAGIWEKAGADYQLKCVDMLDVKKPGFAALPGTCSYSAGDFIGIGQAGLGVVVMNQGLPGVGAGIVQFSDVAGGHPGGVVGAKTTGPGNVACCTTRQYAVKINCSAGWGWMFLLLMFLSISESLLGR